jgi:peptide/nickel transport system substrate-binding protein
MDRIEFIDYGEDPAAWAAAAEADEIDHIYTTEGEFVSIFDTIDGWQRNEISTAGTVVMRPNQKAEVEGSMPYADVNVRRALAMAVNNAVVLELGLTGQGTVAENHHIAPIHPEYTPMPAPVHDPGAAAELMTQAGMAEFEHDLVSLDTGFLKDSADAVAAQLRDAGIKVKRTVMPSQLFGTTGTNIRSRRPSGTTDHWQFRPMRSPTPPAERGTRPAWPTARWTA